MTEDEARAALNPPNYDDIPVPKKTRSVPQFRDGVFALSELLSAEKTPLITVRSNLV
jgi:hypothetical protein